MVSINEFFMLSCNIHLLGFKNESFIGSCSSYSVTVARWNECGVQVSMCLPCVSHSGLWKIRLNPTSGTSAPALPGANCLLCLQLGGILRSSNSNIGVATEFEVGTCNIYFSLIFLFARIFCRPWKSQVPF